MPTDLPERQDNQLPETPDRNGGPSPRLPGSPPADGGSFGIARVAGIPIRVHFTFVLLLAWLALVDSQSKQAHPWANLFFVVGLFACVLLHEIGHALVALRYYGLQTRDIVLYPIGGIARLETLPRPRQELWIALAGPAVNLVIAGILSLVLRLAHLPLGRFSLTGQQPNYLANLMWANLLLAGFNLIPAFPMDGGRILRALLARVMSDLDATAIAARVGQFFAILFGLYGLGSSNLLLVFVAVFVYMGAGQEAAVFQTKALMMGHRVREAMLREFRTLSVGNTLREAAEALLAGSQQDFPVLNGEEVVGVLSRGALLRGMATEGQDGYVAGTMQREFVHVRPDDDLEAVLAQTPYAGPILVMEGDGTDKSGLVGMLTQENLLEFLTLTRLQMRLHPPQ